MEKIFKNQKKKKTNESNKFFYNFTHKLNLKTPNKKIALVSLSIYYTWKIIKSAYNDHKFKISAQNWIDKFDLLDGSYSVSDIQDYFEYIITKHEVVADNLPTQIYFNKTGYKIDLLSKETMKLLGSREIVIDKYKNGKNVPKLEIADVILMHCNAVNYSYQQSSKVLFTLVRNKQFGQFVSIACHSLTSVKTTNKEFPFIEVWFTEQSNRPLEIENNVNITLSIETG